MTLRRLMGQTVQVTSYTMGAEDIYGVAAPVAGTPVQYPARVEEASSTENIVDRDTTVALYRLFLPADAVIGPEDRVTYAGATFEVYGVPMPLVTPAGTVHHVEAVLRRAT